MVKNKIKGTFINIYSNKSLRGAFMQKSSAFNPSTITPKQAAKFRSLFNKYELSEEAACPSSNSKNRLYSYAVKLVNQTLSDNPRPLVVSQNGFTREEVSQIANAIVEKNNAYGSITDIIASMNLTSKTMPIFRKGSTFSSVMVAFIKRVQLIASLQETLASALYSEIKSNADKILGEKSQANGKS